MARTPCCEKAHTNKGAWSKEEDQRLTNHIRAHGEGCWRSLPKAAGRRVFLGSSSSSSSPLITPVPEISVMTKIIDYNNMISNADIKIITHSAEEAKSISGMTEEEEEEEEEEGREEEYPEPEINLDLSLGLQFQKPSANTGESNKSICLCRHLGFQRSQACNCKTMATKITTNGIHSYYRQLDS
ncbi:hypothetical protein HHK36_009124 [Tetracentron sinense]|uniref:Uncharacterized protein n=1 Tax=Tetracentron sinense TaxID=13715 RepID=A0A834ZKE4_TETSI|nr:hypothetical protein HHK36_009124 [Tetracentron sinense]